MQDRSHKKHINGRIFEGVHLKEHYERGQRLSAKRIATLFNPVTKNFRELSEENLLGHLYDIESFVKTLPEMPSITSLLSKAKAGFMLPDSLSESIIDAENAIWLLDHMYGGKTVHVDEVNWEL